MHAIQPVSEGVTCDTDACIILFKKEKLRTGDPCAYPTYFLRSFQAVVQKRGSERHFSKKRQEVGLGNSKLARFTQYSLREMGLNLERTLKLYK